MKLQFWTGLTGVITLYILGFLALPWVVLAGYYVAVWFGRYATWVIVR